ncbi:tetratricopeptide repeat protein [Polynucleobacter paneuropaeus]|nr:tetratricopeptide repeat protein [Polynucleobacter paneuropaeus]
MNPQIAYLLNLSIQQIQSERLNDAERTLNQVLKLQPKNSDAYNFLSVIAAYGLKWEEALELINKSIGYLPNNSVAYSNKGNILKELGRCSEALASYKKAIQLDQKHFEAYNNIGNFYLEVGRYEEAFEAYDKAIELEPNYAEAFSNKGNAHQKIGEYDKAIEMYEKALMIKPAYQEAWLNRGFALNKLKKFEAALESCDQAIALDSNNPLAWTDKGVILFEQNNYAEAIKYYEKAISVNGKFAEAFANKASSLMEFKRYDEALQNYQSAYSIKPNLEYLLGDIVSLKLLLGEWGDLQEDVKKISTSIEGDEKIINPFKLLSAVDSPIDALRVAKNWTTTKFAPKKSMQNLRIHSHSKIRLGYFSADFRNHPVSFLTAELFELHDRDRFEVYAFSVRSAEPGDAMRERLVNAFDHFIDVEHKTDIEVAQLARELEIDIAIDLGGHTQFAPTGIMSYRAAPIQINYLGYPGTMGAPYMDYIIADPILIPPENQQFYSEKVIYLPNTYMVDDSKRAPSSKIFTRQECGLPEDGFIFCCFNNSYKFNKNIIEIWSRVLKATPSSVLWISENNESFKKNLLREFLNLEISVDRIIFAKKVDSMADHLARYKLADLFLDTHPYNAHTTAVDALKAGIPVLTCLGNAFPGRVAASLLNAINLSDLVNVSLEEYENAAIGYALQPEKITALKKQLIINQEKEPLFNTKLYAKNIELAYETVYQNYLRSEPIDHIYV